MKPVFLSHPLFFRLTSKTGDITLSSKHTMMVVFKTFWCCVAKGESYFIRDGAFFVPSHLDNNQGV